MPPAKQQPPRYRPTPPRPEPDGPPEVVDPIWLLQAGAVCLAGALACAWLTVCLLFYQGEWQLVLHPVHTITATPATAHMNFEAVRFDSAETGQPRLTGWLIPAEPQAKYARFTILYLHDGSLSLSNSVPTLALLHTAGFQVFAFDYRGFGLSEASGHPTEARMVADSGAALDYLIATRHLTAPTIIPYGVGLGAALAVGIATQHPEMPAVILDNPDPDPEATAAAQQPSKVIPVRLLFREHFEIGVPLAFLKTPKLLVEGGANSTKGVGQLQAVDGLYRAAASPRYVVTLPLTNFDDQFRQATGRFMDDYLEAAPGRAPARQHP